MSSASLQSSVLDRKARLAALKSKSLKRKEPDSDTPQTLLPDHDSDLTTTTSQQDQDDSSAAQEDQIAASILSGRNYDPSTRGPKLGFEYDPSAGHVTLESQAEALAQKAREEEAAAEAKKAQDALDGAAAGGLDLFQLRPKKPNWDLKRELAERTRVLDLRTENAIARLVRERIEGQNRGKGGGLEGGDLAEAVRVREAQEREEERRERELEAEV